LSSGLFGCVACQLVAVSRVSLTWLWCRGAFDSGGDDAGLPDRAAILDQPGQTAECLRISASMLPHPPSANTTHILESLLHTHHNRYRGIDRDGEGTCRQDAGELLLAASFTAERVHSNQ
jgi:hypothetical protein